jgi:hypothetical protein
MVSTHVDMPSIPDFTSGPGGLHNPTTNRHIVLHTDMHSYHYGPFLSNLAVPCVIARGCDLETELHGAARCLHEM